MQYHIVLWRADFPRRLAELAGLRRHNCNYTSSYDNASIGFGGVDGACQDKADIASSVVSFANGAAANCKSKAIRNVDFTLSQKVTDNVALRFDVLNVFDFEPSLDPSAAYGLFGFNPAWAGPNILGRLLRLGAQVDFQKIGTWV